MASRKRKTPNDAEIIQLHKEWDEISCPICMDHPHNAVLILCNSHEKGCKSFICDTSYRHSNCLDRFKKLVSKNSDNNNNQESVEPNNDTSSLSSKNCLKCPLCRGSVAGWEVVEEARQYLNFKPRNCSQESCTFSGTYSELRVHARRAHPSARPSDVDPTRERAWRRMEHQREYGDIVSAIRSAMPGAVVFGDYAVENGDNRAPNESISVHNNGHWWTAFFLFQMIGSMETPPADRRAARVPTRHRRRRRRLMWGESLLGFQDDDNDNDDDDDDDDDEEEEEDNGDPFALDLVDVNDDDRSSRTRRRRLTRYRSDEDQS